MQIPVIAWFVYGAIRLIGPTLRLDVVGARNAVLIEHGGEVAIGAFCIAAFSPPRGFGAIAASLS